MLFKIIYNFRRTFFFIENSGVKLVWRLGVEFFEA